MPWETRNILRLYLASFLGFTLVALGWYGSSGTAELRTQLAWVNLSVIGLILGGTANALWLVHGHRAVRARERAMLTRSTALIVDEPAAIEEPALVTVAGATRAHRPGCPLVRGKQTVTVVVGRLRPCETCLQ